MSGKDLLENAVNNRTVLLDSAFQKLERRGIDASGGGANVDRVQAFLDAPRTRIGEASRNVADALAQKDPERHRLLRELRGQSPMSADRSISKTSLSPPGTFSSFGDGDGFYWDRWLVSNNDRRAETAPIAKFLEDQLPSFSSPRSGFKATKSKVSLTRRRGRSSQDAQDSNAVEEAIKNCQKQLDEMATPSLPKIDTREGNRGKTKSGTPHEDASPAVAVRSELAELWNRKLQYQSEKRRKELNPSPAPLEDLTTRNLGRHLPSSLETSSLCDASLVSSTSFDDPKTVASMLSSGDQTAMNPANYFGTTARTHFYQQYRQLEKVKEKFTVGELLSLKNNGSINFVPERSAQIELFNSGGDVKDAMSISDSLSSTMQVGGILGAVGPGTETMQSSTPRTLYIEELIFGDDDKMVPHKIPQAGFIIRNPTERRPRTEINLNFQGIGDKNGIALARIIEDMPDLEVLCIQDNRLTDESLGPILQACINCKQLKKLDVGGNKMDEKASEAMGELLGHYACSITSLGMCKADVDDTECGELIEKLADNYSVTELDLSNNLIGNGESINIVNPDFDTGGEAIAEMLEKGGILKSLNLAWNAIRSDSARQLGDSLSSNTVLLHLDLSYNSFGDSGGQAIGGALFTNNTLRRLNLANNSIPCRAAYSIAAGARHNTSLEDLDLRGNPCGMIGGRALMQVPIDCRDRIALHLEGCDMTLDDGQFFVDQTTQLPREPISGDDDNKYNLDLSIPYRRAMGLDIFRIVAEEPGFLIEESKLNGEVLNLERETLKRKHDPNDVVGLLENAVKNVDELWLKYDVDGSGTVDISELTQLLKDLKLDATKDNVDRVFATYDCDNSGLLEIDELLEFLESAKRDYHERTKPRTVMVKNRGEEFMLPHEGTLFISLGFNPEKDILPRTTTSEELAMLIHQANKTDDRAGALQLSFGLMRLQVEQAQELIGHLRKDFSDIIKILVMVLPYMSSAHHAQVLVTMYLREDYKERRRLEQELGPAYKPVMGMYTGHYKLDLSKDVHRIALMKLAEVNTLESRKRRHVRDSIAKSPKDISQKGNWYNYRNETLNNQPFQINPDFFDPLTPTGTIEFDFVSTTRPTANPAVISSRRFFSLMKKFGWVEGNNDEYRKMSNFLSHVPPPYVMTEEEIYRYDLQLAICRGDDDIPPPDPKSPKSGLGSNPMSPKSLTSQKSLTAPKTPGSPKSPKGFSSEPATPKTEGVDYVSAGEMKISDYLQGQNLKKMPSGNYSSELMSPLSPGSEPITPDGSATPLSGEVPNAKLSLTSIVNLKKRAHRAVNSLRTGSHLDMLCNLRDIVYTRWFSCSHAAWILNNCPINFEEEVPEKVRDWKVDVALDMFTRIADIENYDVVLAAMSPEERAKVTHRLGLLNYLNPHRMDLNFCLHLRQREDRIAMKMIIHMSVIEPGENVTNESFRWDRLTEPMPGWEIKQTWFREDGLPTKGIFMGAYCSGPNWRWADRPLRTALTNVCLVNASEEQRKEYMEETGMTFNQYITESLGPGCIEDCGTPITWDYDKHDTPFKYR